MQVSATVTLLSAHWDGQFLSLEEMILGKNQTAALNPFLQDHTSCDYSKQTPEWVKVRFPKVQDPAVCLVPSFLDPELHNLLVAAAKAAPSLHPRPHPPPDWV